VELNNISGSVVDSAMKVHSILGPGLLESVYQKCLAHELRKRALRVETELALPVIYDGIEIEVGYRIDLLVAGEVIVEIKSVTEIIPLNKAQLLSYLRLSRKRLGLLLNFNVAHMKDGLSRIVNNL
jgi:GxxExxY protein